MKLPETLCTFVQSKKLKELGYSTYTQYAWVITPNHGPYLTDQYPGKDYNGIIEVIYAPTLIAAQYWFWNVYSIWIELLLKDGNKFQFTVINNKNSDITVETDFTLYNSPERALDAAIDLIIENF